MKIMIKKFFGYHDALKIYGAPKLCTVCSKMTIFPPSVRSAKSSLAPSDLDLYGLSYPQTNEPNY